MASARQSYSAEFVEVLQSSPGSAITLMPAMLRQATAWIVREG